MDAAHFDGTPEMRKALGFDAEAMWDQRAEQFNASQLRGGFMRPDGVVDLLQEKDLLRGKTVLDVGGGTGRYAIPFARSASRVTVTDISANMLSYARGNAEAEDLFNLSYRKMDWETSDLKELGWERAFDLVFASMCPAARSQEGLDRMTAASRGVCVFCQVIFSQDSLGQFLRERLRPNRNYDAHNDRGIVLSHFSRLWNQGYDPELHYLRRSEDRSCSVEEAAEQYSGRYGLAAREQNADLIALVRDYAGGGETEITSRSTLAVLLWNVSPA